MTLLESAAGWVGGEVAQGKVMLALGAVLLLGCYVFWQQGSDLARGLILPMIIVVVVSFSYGGWLVSARPGQLDKIRQADRDDAVSALISERQRAQKEIDAYGAYKIAWIAIVGLSLLGIVLIGNRFLYGLSLGFLIFGCTALTVDAFLENRITQYSISINSVAG